MNFSEFKEKLGAEPRATSETHRDNIAADEQMAEATREALAFEDRLEAALRVDIADDDLLAGILAQARPEQRKAPPRWLAIAASVLLVVGVSSVFLWQGAAPKTLAEYVQAHYDHDGAAVLAKASQGQATDEVQAVLANLGVNASPELASEIMFVKFCPTPDGRGAHMVVNTGNGPATVIFMPSVNVDQPVLISLDDAAQTTAEVISLTTGSAAIIGADAATRRQLEASLSEGLQSLSVDA